MRVDIEIVKRNQSCVISFAQYITDEKTVVNSHSNELPYKFAVNCKGSPRQTSFDLLITSQKTI